MKVGEILALVDEEKPNLIADEMKIGWLNTVERKIFTNVVESRENPDEIQQKTITEQDFDVDLIAPEEYADVYRYYILAKIDYVNQETDLYMNDSQMFNQAFIEFANYWTRTHKQIGPGHFEV
jgi:hypothetical protein